MMVSDKFVSGGLKSEPAKIYGYISATWPSAPVKLKGVLSREMDLQSLMQDC